MAEFMRIEDLKVHYPIRSGFLNRVTDYVYAVDGVNLTLEEGKTYGLVGEVYHREGHHWFREDYLRENLL